MSAHTGPLCFTLHLPTHLFLPPNIHTIRPFLPPSSPPTLKCPAFRSAAQWAAIRYVTSFLESLPPVRCRCITCQLSLSDKNDPLMEMASTPPQVNVPASSNMTCYTTGEENSDSDLHLLLLHLSIIHKSECLFQLSQFTESSLVVQAWQTFPASSAHLVKPLLITWPAFVSLWYQQFEN